MPGRNIFVLIVLTWVYTCNAVNLKDAFQTIGESTKYAESITQAVNKSGVMISESCSANLYKYATGLLSDETWALKMFDSNSKLPSGILNGRVIDLGSFDECIGVKWQANPSEYILGKYCLGTIPIKLSGIDTSEQFVKVLKNISNSSSSSIRKVGIQLATCIPHTCSIQDIAEIYAAIGLGMSFSEVLCQTKPTIANLDTAAYIGIVFFSTVIGIICLATCYDVVLLYLNRKPASSLLVALSAFENGKRLAELRRHSNQISCLHGIRVLATMWIIYGHTRRSRYAVPTSNYFENANWYKNEANMYQINLGHQVDTFLLIGGLLVSFNYMSATQKKIKFNILTYYIHRYLRLTPTLMAIVIFYITLLIHMGSGPLWPNYIENTEAAVCRTNWWKALLHIQNYGNTEAGMCIPPSWYVSMDFQLYLLSPIILTPLKRWPKITLLAVALLSMCSVTYIFTISWIYEIGIARNVNKTPIQLLNYLQLYYFSISARAAPWLIGFILGYIIFKIKVNRDVPRLKKTTVFALWMVSIGAVFACLFAGHHLVLTYQRLWSATHMALVKLFWAIAISWMIYACNTGYGGIINSFLGLPLFELLSKLTYAMYLVHFSVITVVGAQMRETSTRGDLQTVYEFWGNFMLSLLASIFLTIAFEMPVLEMEKIIFRKKEGNEKRSMVAIPSEQETRELQAVY